MAFLHLSFQGKGYKMLTWARRKAQAMLDEDKKLNGHFVYKFPRSIVYIVGKGLHVYIRCLERKSDAPPLSGAPWSLNETAYYTVGAPIEVRVIYSLMTGNLDATGEHIYSRIPSPVTDAFTAGTSKGGFYAEATDLTEIVTGIPWDSDLSTKGFVIEWRYLGETLWKYRFVGTYVGELDFYWAYTSVVAAEFIDLHPNYVQLLADNEMPPAGLTNAAAFGDPNWR